MKKVRCINDLGFENRLKHNDTYTVTKEIKGRYILKETGEAYEFGVERFQEVIENAKELNIIEAMKMPVGTEFEVIFNGEQIENNTMIIYRSLEGDNERKHMDWKSHPQDTYMKPYDFLINGIFIPIEKSVSFMDVVNSDKRCRVEYPNAPDGYWFLDDMLYWLGNEHSSESCAEIIKNGKWYLEN